MLRRAILAVAIVFAMDMFVYGMTIPSLAAEATRLGLSESGSTLVFGGYALGLLPGAFVASVMVRRWGERVVFLAGFCMLGLAVTAYAAATTIELLVILRCLQGAAAGASWTAGPALVARLLGEDRNSSQPRLDVAMATVQGAGGLGFFAGPALGGGLYTVWESLSFAMVGGLCLLGLAVVAWLLRPLGREEVLSTKPSDHIAPLRLRQLLPLTFPLIIGAAVLAALEPLLSLWTAKILGTSSAMIGVSFSLSVLGYALGAWLTPVFSARLSARRLSAAGLVVLGTVLGVVPWLVPITGLGIALLGIGFAAAFVIVPVMPSLARYVWQTTGQGYEQAFFTYNVAYALGLGAGPVLGALGAAALDVVQVLWAFAFLAIVAGWGLLWYKAKI